MVVEDSTILKMFREAAEDGELKQLLDTVFSADLTEKQKRQVESIIDVVHLQYIWGLDWKTTLKNALQKFIDHYNLKPETLPDGAGLHRPSIRRWIQSLVDEELRELASQTENEELRRLAEEELERRSKQKALPDGGGVLDVELEAVFEVLKRFENIDVTLYEDTFITLVCHGDKALFKELRQGLSQYIVDEDASSFCTETLAVYLGYNNVSIDLERTITPVNSTVKELYTSITAFDGGGLEKEKVFCFKLQAEEWLKLKGLLEKAWHKLTDEIPHYSRQLDPLYKFIAQLQHKTKKLEKQLKQQTPTATDGGGLWVRFFVCSPPPHQSMLAFPPHVQRKKEVEKNG